MFAEVIRTLRRMKGVSQNDVAISVGVTQQAVNRWENNQAVPNLEVLNGLVGYFGVSADYFLGNKSLDGLVLSEEELGVVKGYRRLNDKRKCLVRELINQLGGETEPSLLPASEKIVQSNYRNSGGTNIVNVGGEAEVKGR